MAYKKSNPNSQASSANSEPVVLSTEQEAKIDLLATKAKQDLLLAELQLKADLSETQPVSIAGTVAVSGTFFQATQPVSAASLPLPSGAATSAKQDLLLTELQLKADLTETQPVSLASIPLATGASTSALQTTGNSSLSSIDTKLSSQSTAANQTTGNTSLSNIDTKTPSLGQALAAASTPVVLTAIQVSALTPPAAITGFVTETNFDTKTGSLTETAPASDTASSGLNGRLQRIAQRITSLITALGSPFQAGGSIGNTAFGVNNASGASAVNIQDGGNSITVDGTVTANISGSISNTAFTANAGTNLNTSALALETGGNLASIKTNTDKIPAQGQALAAASLPVVLTAAQVSTLTPQTNAITDAQIRATPLPISGTVTTGGLTDTQIRATPLPVSGTVSANATLSAETTKVIGTVNIAASQTLSTVTTVGAVTAITNALPTGANTIGAVTNANLDVALSTRLKPADTLAGVTALGSITNALPAGNNNIGDVDIVTMPNVTLNALPTGANVIGALTANQSVNVAQLNGVAITMGNGVAGTGVQRVAISSDNTAFSVNATLSAETTKVIGTVNMAASQTIAVTQPTPANLQATVTPITITKGTQGVTGFTTQDLKDAGRNPVHYYTVIPVLTSATDTLQSLTGTKSGATVVATTTPAVVTTGKTLRVTRLAATYIATATSGYGIVRLRFNTAGVVAVTSPIAATLCIGAGTPATANSTSAEEATLYEAIEFAAGTGIGISVQGFAAVTATAVGYVLVSVTGYEY